MCSINEIYCEVWRVLQNSNVQMFGIRILNLNVSKRSQPIARKIDVSLNQRLNLKDVVVWLLKKFIQGGRFAEPTTPSENACKLATVPHVTKR